jgi:hypothetical protein
MVIYYKMGCFSGSSGSVFAALCALLCVANNLRHCLYCLASSENNLIATYVRSEMNTRSKSKFKIAYLVTGCIMLLFVAGLVFVPGFYGQEGLYEFVMKGVDAAEASVPIIGSLLLPMAAMMLLGFPLWVISLAWDKDVDRKIDELGQDMGLYTKVDKKKEK